MSFERLNAKEAVWNNQPVYRFIGRLAELTPMLPRFQRQRFAHEGALNEYLDLILREPHEDDERLVPVATVSRRYALIQHRDVVDWVRTAFEEQGWDPAAVTACTTISEYGERMSLRIEVPEAREEIEAGDVIGAEIRIWNSVDRSRAFEVAIGWVRLVCSNGLTVWNEDRLRKIHHVDWMSQASPVEFLRERLPKSRARVAQLRRWREVAVPAQELVAWIDGPVAKAWGKGRAARLFHICRTGHDGDVGRFVSGKPPSGLQVSSSRIVPGAPARAENAYDIYQALLWLGGRERAVEEQETKTEEALDLIRHFLPQALREHAH